MNNTTLLFKPSPHAIKMYDLFLSLLCRHSITIKMVWLVNAIFEYLATVYRLLGFKNVNDVFETHSIFLILTVLS